MLSVSGLSEGYEEEVDAERKLSEKHAPGSPLGILNTSDQHNQSILGAASRLDQLLRASASNILRLRLWSLVKELVMHSEGEHEAVKHNMIRSSLSALNQCLKESRYGERDVPLCLSFMVATPLSAAFEAFREAIPLLGNDFRSLMKVCRSSLRKAIYTFPSTLYYRLHWLGLVLLWPGMHQNSLQSAVH